MVAFPVLLRKELREQWRTMRLPVTLGAFAFLGILSPVLAKFTPELVRAMAGAGLAAALSTPQASDAVDQFLKNIGQFGAVVAILVAMGAVVSEKERGTAAFVLTSPAGRGAYLGAKLAALAVLLALAVAIAGLCTYAYTALLFSPLPAAGFALACLMVWLLLSTCVAVTFLGSTVAPSAVAAAGIGFGWLILGGAAAALPAIGADVPASLVGPARALALGAPAGDLAGPVAVSVAVVLCALLAARMLFARQEL